MTGSEHYFWGDKNIFRILADCTHLSSKVILIYTIHRLRSAEGISLLTQFLYLVVFLLRYLDLFWTFTYSKYNTSFKLFYIVSSVYTLFIMMKVFKRSREGEKEWRVAGWSLLGSFVVGVLGCLVFEEKKSFDLFLWNISIVLESFHLLPQISLLSHVSVSTAINSYYLVALGSYRAIYILNWIVKYNDNGRFDTMPFVFGIIQTLVYVEFAWVYWRRQKVKLRETEGVLDEEDWVTGGWGLLRLIYGGKKGNVDVTTSPGGDWREWGRSRWNQFSGTARGRSGGGGLSVSADEGGVGGILRGESNGGMGYADRASEDGLASTAVGNARDRHAKGDMGRDEEEGQVLVGGDSSDEEEEGDDDDDEDDGLVRD